MGTWSRQLGVSVAFSLILVAGVAVAGVGLRPMRVFGDCFGGESTDVVGLKDVEESGLIADHLI